jgi:uncharacterized protein (DUF342 family)
LESKIQELQKRLDDLKERASNREERLEDLTDLARETVKNIQTRNQGQIPNDCSADANLLIRIRQLGIIDKNDKIIS